MPDHNRLLALAGREALAPLGLRQQGRSRTWIDDHGWWVCAVTFSSSRWSKGSGLAVFADFLWRDGFVWRDAPSLAMTYREPQTEAPHIEFENEQQFSPHARYLGARAALDVHYYRERFPDLRSWNERLTRSATRWPWEHDRRILDAGISNGLLGLVDEARKFLRAHAATATREQNRALHLESLLDDNAAFREEIASAVARSRKALMLPEQPIDF